MCSSFWIIPVRGGTFFRHQKWLDIWRYPSLSSFILGLFPFIYFGSISPSFPHFSLEKRWGAAARYIHHFRTIQECGAEAHVNCCSVEGSTRDDSGEELGPMVQWWWETPARWLVGLEHDFYCFHVLGVVISTDELIVFRGVGRPPIRWWFWDVFGGRKLKLRHSHVGQDAQAPRWRNRRWETKKQIMWHSHQKMIKNEYVRLCKGIRPTTHKDIRIWLRLNLRTPNSSSSLVIFRGGITLYHPFSWTLPLLPRIFFIATMPMFKSCLGVLPPVEGPLFWNLRLPDGWFTMSNPIFHGWLKAPFPKAASSTSFSLSWSISVNLRASRVFQWRAWFCLDSLAVLGTYSPFNVWGISVFLSGTLRYFGVFLESSFDCFSQKRLRC